MTLTNGIVDIVSSSVESVSFSNINRKKIGEDRSIDVKYYDLSLSLSKSL
jgi:hypothetical protein